MKNQKTSLNRLILQVAIVLYLLGIFHIISRYTFVVDAGILKTLGIFSFTIAFLAGIVALIKFDTRNKSKYIFVSTGLIGASILDAIYMIAPGPLSNSWMWNSSAAYLSVMSLLSYLVWIHPKFKNVGRSKENKRTIALVGTSIALVLFFVFVLGNFPKSYLVVISSLALLIAIAGYLNKGTWKYKYFDHLFISSLIFLLSSQALFVNFSRSPSDNLYVLSEIQKIAAYSIALSGLLMSTYNAFRLAEVRGETIEARLRSSIGHLPLGYILMNEQNKILMLNDKVKEIILKKKKGDFDNLVRKHFKIKTLADKAYKKGETMLLKDRVYKDRILDLSVTPVFRGTDYIGSLILIADVTEARLLERTKDEFIALASHELRTPLVTVRGNIDLLKKIHPKILKDESVLEIVNDIEIASSYSISMVDEFLDVFSLEQGRIKYKIKEFDIYEQIEGVCEVFKDQAHKKSNQIIISGLKDKKVKVKSDEVRTKQVLSNMIDNAIKFTDNGEINVKLEKKGGKAVITVSDTGRGISTKAQETLFKKIQQVGDDFYKHDSTQGVGLGLYISKMLVRGMGGNIYLVRSEEGKGSEFAFTLPLA